MCKGDINCHQPKTAKINLGLNHHVLHSRTALTRRAILNTCKIWCFLLAIVALSMIQNITVAAVDALDIGRDK